MRKLNLLFLTGLCFHLTVACQPSENSSKTPAGGNLTDSSVPGQKFADRTFIEAAEYEKLLSLEDEALSRKALIGQLGSCKLEKYSESGCGPNGLNIPLYQIVLGNGKALFPNSMSGKPLRSCFDRTGGDLKTALKEGFCFSNHVPFEQMSNDGLARKAFFNDLGNCRLVQFSESGCGLISGIPLFLIHLGDKDVNFPNMSKETSDKYCLSASGYDLRKALNEGYCF
jgi:hypothetical protein